MMKTLEDPASLTTDSVSPVDHLVIDHDELAQEGGSQSRCRMSPPTAVDLLWAARVDRQHAPVRRYYDAHRCKSSRQYGAT